MPGALYFRIENPYKGDIHENNSIRHDWKRTCQQSLPHSLHAEPVISALERGLHVLNEKPMAASFEDCQRMVSLAEDKGAIFMSLPFELHPVFLAASEFVNERYIGKVTGAEAQLSLPGPWRDN
ncbi:MAG: Gfo/Idh/MocA family oxidoreductase [Paenibacillus dendritiformis]|uniref:Gfo/Idh/MocA family protein n=1 Tax=uncultured Paenibacillus sp. TaxID=227322 RepID=UPI0025E94080|nr:Gfo/Idh/MocA family oxidoreductase [uncultured Paenibacillus sp.]MDU5145795.1 Gfo/Idh/MocA family oxidoreductase [Paenibacillus dendritiformis]